MPTDLSAEAFPPIIRNAELPTSLYGASDM